MSDSFSVYEKIHKLLEECRAEAVMVTDPYNIRYLSGFSGGEGYLYISKNSRIIYVDSRYTIWAKNECYADFEVVETGRERYKEINRVINEEGIYTIAVEGKQLSYNQYMMLSESLEANELVPLGEQLNELRIIKSKEEIGFIKQAEKIGDDAFSYILGELKTGMTEKDVALKLEFYMRTHGADGLSFDVIAASGINSACPHAMPSDKKLEYGDFLTLDFGCVYKGYCSDMTRTVVMGKASDKQKDIYNIVKSAQAEALNSIKAGITGKEADSYARQIIEDAGYGDCFGHGTGHGIGLFIHEMPALSINSDMLLKPGMVVSVEPGIYVEGFGGVRIEDAVAIEENGVCNLTESTKELLEIQ